MNYDQFLHRPHPFLAGLSETHLRMLADHASTMHFPAGARIFHESEAARHFYLIQSGKVVLQTHSGGHPVMVQKLGSGEVLGWSWLFPPYCWHFDAWAEEDTEVIAFEALRLRDDCETDKTFGYELMKRVADVLIHRLQGARLKLVQARKPDLHTELPIGG